ncbi:hypothetical protein ACVWYS_004129 [Arthrobacter sp. TE12231]
METIYVLEAVSHAADIANTAVDDVKQILDLLRHLAACSTYLNAVFDSRQRPAWKLIVRIFSCPAQRLDEIQAIYTGVNV